MDLFFFLRGKKVAHHIDIGRSGEVIAARFLRRHGYKIVQRNIRVGKKDEIDILAFDSEDRILVFVEVKTRARATEYQPELNMTPEKRFAMARAARRWMVLHEMDTGYRFDVVCIVDGKVTEHYKEIDMENTYRKRPDRITVR